MSDRTFRNFSDAPDQCYLLLIWNFRDCDSTLLQPTQGALKNFFPPAFCSHPGVPTGVSTCRLHALCSTSLGCVLMCVRRYATVRTDASAHHESILRMCWISVFTFLVLASPCDCLSLLMFEVGCQAALHPRARAQTGEKGGVCE